MGESVGNAFNNCRKFIGLGFSCSLNLVFCMWAMLVGLDGAMTLAYYNMYEKEINRQY